MKISFGEEFKEESGSEIKVIDKYMGNKSKITDKQYYRILSEDDFVQLWQKHSDDMADMPKVDFDSNMVVAVFWGIIENYSGVRTGKVTESGDVIYFHFTPMYYQTSVSTFDSNANQGYDEVQPYGIFVIPRINKRLILIHDFYPIGGPVEMYVVKELEGLK